jgi:hypothetical protein
LSFGYFSPKILTSASRPSFSEPSAHQVKTPTTPPAPPAYALSPEPASADVVSAALDWLELWLPASLLPAPLASPVEEPHAAATMPTTAAVAMRIERRMNASFRRGCHMPPVGDRCGGRVARAVPDANARMMLIHTQKLNDYSIVI